MDMQLIQALDDLRRQWTQVETNDSRRVGLLDRLDRLSLLLTYQGFDLEATRRENATLRRAMKQSRHRRH
ncbi:MAG: hypothetical protein ACOYMI_09540 [Phycisphaerales bacterium]|jgi:hypothetical protein